MSSRRSPPQGTVDDTVAQAEKSADYTTSGEVVHIVDTSGGAVTVTIASSDIPDSGSPARVMTFINIGNNDLTLTTQGGETIKPVGASSITYSTDQVTVEAKLAAGAVHLDRNKDLAALTTEQVVNTNISPDRSLFTTEDTTVTVDAGGGQDYTSIQDAVDDIPLFVNHQYRININAGDYSAEDVLVPQIYSSSGSVTATGSGDDEFQAEDAVKILGDRSTPSNVKIGSVVVENFHGSILKIKGFQGQSDNPHDDESVVFAAYHSNEVSFGDIEFAGGTDGFLAYGSHIEIQSVDFGNNVLSGNGVVTKHHGWVTEQGTQGTSGIDIQGNVPGSAYKAGPGGAIWIIGSSTLTADTTRYDQAGGEIRHTSQGGFLHTLRFFDDLDVRGNSIKEVGLITAEGDDTGSIQDNAENNRLIWRFDGSKNVWEFYDDSDDLIMELLSGGGISVFARSADPTTSELAAGETAIYRSDGSAGVEGDAGDLIYAINDGGTIETAIIVDESADAS